MNGRPDGRARLMQCVVYILWFIKDGSKYIGYTGDFSRRMSNHIHGRSQYTSRKGPFKLIYVELFTLKREAKAKEKFLKSRKGRNYLKKYFG